MKVMNVKSLVINIVLVFVFSFIVMLFSKDIRTISEKSVKPSFYPPSYVFGIVWSILFIIYGYMLYDIYNNRKDNKMYFLAILLLVITLLWTPVFTNTKSYKLSFYYIFFVLLLNILFLIYSKNMYIIPQILWISFATFLSYRLYKLNERD
jgi:benzodiazapine receptor